MFINAVQHIVHPPQHLERWPTDDHRSRIVFITRGIDHAAVAALAGGIQPAAQCADVSTV